MTASCCSVILENKTPSSSSSSTAPLAVQRLSRIVAALLAATAGLLLFRRRLLLIAVCLCVLFCLFAKTVEPFAVARFFDIFSEPGAYLSIMNMPSSQLGCLPRSPSHPWPESICDERICSLARPLTSSQLWRPPGISQLSLCLADFREVRTSTPRTQMAHKAPSSSPNSRAAACKRNPLLSSPNGRQQSHPATVS